MRNSYLCRICCQQAEDVILLMPGYLYDPRVSLCRVCLIKEHVANKINGKNQKNRISGFPQNL